MLSSSSSKSRESSLAIVTVARFILSVLFSTSFLCFLGAFILSYGMIPPYSSLVSSFLGTERGGQVIAPRGGQVIGGMSQDSYTLIANLRKELSYMRVNLDTYQSAAAQAEDAKMNLAF